jgi:enoyl-CoA hydratase/carnithine racemase
MDRSALEAPVVIEHTGDVLTFTLNRRDVGNEVSVAMFDAMSDALRSEAVQPKARVLRIRANGDVFCTGRERAVSIRTEVARLIELKRLVRNTSLISIAQVQGDALGFGFGLAILCDFTLVASSARLGFPEMRSGLPPAAIMAYLGGYALPKALFPMVLFGDPITPEAALQAGLVTRVCDRANLHADADALAARILSLDEAGAKQCKAFFLAAQEGSVEQNFRAATDMLTVNALRLMQTR